MNDAIADLPLSLKALDFLQDNLFLAISCGFLLLFFASFLAMTYRNYITVTRRLQRLHDAVKEAFQNQSINDDTFSRSGSGSRLGIGRGATGPSELVALFCQYGFGGAGRHIARNSTTFIGLDAAFIPVDAVQRFLTPGALERTQVPMGAASRSAVLTSLGALGTFVGLVMGVGSAAGGLASSDSRVAISAIAELLSGAQLAFITSILGLSLSMVHGWFLTAQRRRLTEQAEITQDYICHALNAKEGSQFTSIAIHTLKNTHKELANQIDTKLQSVILPLETLAERTSDLFTSQQNSITHSKHVAHQIGTICVKLDQRSETHLSTLEKVEELLSEISAQQSAAVRDLYAIRAQDVQPEVA